MGPRSKDTVWTAKECLRLQAARGALLFVTTLGSPAGGGAVPPSPAPPGGFGVEEAVRTALARSPDIRVAAWKAEGDRGVLLAAAAPFDLQLDTSIKAGQQHTSEPGASTETASGTYGLGLRKQLRSGLLLNPELGLAQASPRAPAGTTVNSGSVRLNLVLPLAKDRWGALTAAPERAARSTHEASLLEERHAAFRLAYATAIAYWDYVATLKRLTVFESSEARAQRMVEETQVLVEAEERTRADLIQVQGNLALKRGLRIVAEQAVTEARYELGTAMGLSAAESAALPPATTDFPAQGRGSATADGLLALSRAHRADLAAADKSVRAVQTLHDAARNDLRPRLDLLVGAGYGGLETGGGVGPFFAGAYRNVPGLDASVEVRWQFPTANAAARGRLLESTAALEQQRLARDDLERRIGAGVLLAADSLRRGESEIEAAAEAIRLLETTVQSEVRKFQLGESTLFDVILAQDSLTTAMLARITAERGLAVGIVRLRFETGTLLDGATGPPAVDLASLTTPP